MATTVRITQQLNVGGNVTAADLPRIIEAARQAVIKSALMPAAAKGQRRHSDQSARNRRPPRRGVTKVSAWRRYYAAKAAWYDEQHQFFTRWGEYSFAAIHCATQRDRFLEGIRELDAGRHPHQISGVWK